MAAGRKSMVIKSQKKKRAILTALGDDEVKRIHMQHSSLLDYQLKCFSDR